MVVVVVFGVPCWAGLLPLPSHAPIPPAAAAADATDRYTNLKPVGTGAFGLVCR